MVLRCLDFFGICEAEEKEYLTQSAQGTQRREK
jgi:hypothetical protein